jgi:hypothetical protein
MHTLNMLLVGRVFVIAGDEKKLALLAAEALHAEARVAVVSRTLPASTEATVRFTADPRDPDAWERIAMYVEQHLGPVDGVVTDEQSRVVVEAVFGPDLARRGRGAVRVVLPEDDVEALVTQLGVTHPAGRPPAAPSRPRPVAPDQ